MEILKAINIYKSYYKSSRKISVLKDISINVVDSEIIALIGPSGSGKSSLLNILGTLDQDYGGTLIIDNEIIDNSSNLSYLRRNKLGFIFQFHHLLPEFNVYENLLIPQLILKNNVDIYNNIEEMLKLTSLDKRKYHYPSELSGGERQRIAVIRALLNKPSIVLADEPTGNLDNENSKLLLKLIVKLQKKYKQSFIIATHDESVINIADRILYLNDGKINRK